MLGVKDCSVFLILKSMSTKTIQTKELSYQRQTLQEITFEFWGFKICITDLNLSKL